MSSPSQAQDPEEQLPLGMIHSESITAVSEFALSTDQVSDKEPKNQACSTTLTTASTCEGAEEHLVNATSANAGARVLFCTDEWFAAADNLLKDSPPVFDPDAYCEQGKVMDGWESRRRREAGHDWCIVQLASRHQLSKVQVDTAYFTGNNAPAISIQVADLTCTQATAMASQLPLALERLLHGGRQGTGATPDQVQQADQACQSVGPWKEVLPRTPLQPGYEETRLHDFSLLFEAEATHVRINYYPDGGVARLRLWGQPLPTMGPKPQPLYFPIQTGAQCTVVKHSNGPEQMPSVLPFPHAELSAQENGGIGLTCSNKHYGDPWNLIQSNSGRDMGDGWETARNPQRPPVLVQDPTTGLVDSPLSDWCILQLGRCATQGLQRIILDTKHFRGNYPESVQVQGCYETNSDALLMEDSSNADSAVEWFPLISRCRMAPDSEHVFDHHQISNATRPVSHIRVTIYPDGGLSRVRVYGS